MIDLHSHILPNLDDGAADLETALAMARAWVADGVACVACTPHILPGLYHNTGAGIRDAVAALAADLARADIPLQLVPGADNHVTPSFVSDLRLGHLLTLADSRYVLVEPPHHILPASMELLFSDILLAGYVPILTHPERLTWIDGKYDVVQRLAGNGVWMQLTAGSIIGAFGRSPRYWSERMLAEGLVHIVASDAHDTRRRPPLMGAAFGVLEDRVGLIEATNLVETRPRCILMNAEPSSVDMPTGTLSRDKAGTGIYAQNARDHRRGGFAGRLRRIFAG